MGIREWLGTGRRLLGAALAVFGVVVLLLWWSPWSADEPPLDAPRTVAAMRGDIEDVVTAVGNLQPLRYVDVGTQVSGQLQKILAVVGQDVKQGQLLAEIDPTVLQARVYGSEAQLLSLMAQISEREAQLALADAQLQRQRMLMAGAATSQDAVETALTARKTLLAQIEALRAQIMQIDASLDADRANLRYTKIFAPISGTVVDVSAREGQTVIAVQQAPVILRIADLSTMTVVTQVSEADIKRLKVGMVANFTTLGDPDKKRAGTLRQILPTPKITNNVVLYSALFDTANPDGDLLPDMSAQVLFTVASAKNVITVPAEAVKVLPGRGPVVRVFKNGAVEMRPVKLGISDRALSEIVSGVEEGEAVVVDGPNVPPQFMRRTRPARL